jgi:ribosomal protein S18 acetylase RimI-like enzyme
LLCFTPAPEAILHIRPAIRADLPAIGRLGALLVETHHAFDPRRFLEATDQTRTAYAGFLGTQLDRTDATVLVASDEDAVAGYAYVAIDGYDYLSLRGPAGILHDIIVTPELRGRGVGRLLLEAAFDYVKARGVPRIVLSTAAQNEAAQRLFARAGFRPTMIEMTLDIDPGVRP